MWIETNLRYDSHGGLTSVTDANGNETTSRVDDFGQTVRTESPVTGVSTGEVWGRGGKDNFSYQKLRELAQEYLKLGGK